MFSDRMRSRPLLLLVAAAAATVVLAPAASAQSEQDVKEANAARDAAYERLVAIRDEVDATLTEYDDIRGQIFDVEYQLERLTSRISRDQAEAVVLEEKAKRVLVSAYVNRTPDVVEVALQADTIQDLVTRRTLMDRANEANITALERLRAVSRELDRLSGRLGDDREALDALRLEAEKALEQVNLLLERAQLELNRTDAAAREAKELWQAELARRRAEEERKRREAEAKKSSGGARTYGGLICPQQEPMWFRNDWGNPRSGGRTHKGNDIFGARGKDVYAVTSGSLRTRTGGLGGIALWLYGNDGNAYYYAHLDKWASGIQTGTRVNQGQVIGYVGNTGNAVGGAHHTHFQLHPGGGAPVNPYWTLAQVCNR